MADTKITALTALTAADPSTDVLPIVDTSDTTMAASGTTKKISINNILGASGTATLASATITGDLTVDTSTLKVDSANNRVGIGTATPAVDLHIQAAGTASAEVRLASATRSYSVLSSGSGYGSANNLVIYDITGSAERWRLDNTGVQTWSNVGGVAGTAMTLNSTGLGVGYTPSGSADKLGSAATLGVVATGVTADLNFRNSSLTAIQRIRYTDGTGVLTIGSASTVSYQVELGGNTTTRAVTIDASSNVGIGVTSLSRKFEVHGTPVTIGGTATGMLVTVANNGTAYNASPTSGFALWNKFNSSGSLFPSAAIQAGKENATDGNYAGFLSLYTVNSVGTPNEQLRIDSSGNVISNVTGTAPTLATNSQMVFNLTSNTNLRISVRGTDGTTRTANITLA